MIEALAKRLRNTRLLGPLSTEQISKLLLEREIMTAEANDIIFKEADKIEDHLILIEGELEAQRTWSVPNKNDKTYTRTIRPADIDGGFAFICAANQLRVRALTDVRYVLIHADSVDAMLGWSQQLSKEVEENEELRRRMNLVKHVSIFHDIPFENVRTAFACMYTRDVNAGDIIVRQGDAGDSYFVLDSGEAKVIRLNPFTDELSTAINLGPGDAFGEEALLQNAYRNATIEMTTPGRLLVLDKEDFNILLTPHLVEEVTAETAKNLIDNGKAKWIDCRYDLEYEESRIPGAPLFPLDRLRWDVHNLDPEQTYVVYCRSGKRSKAGAFLLRECNIEAMSLIGGIKDWPYDIDTKMPN